MGGGGVKQCGRVLGKGKRGVGKEAIGTKGRFLVDNNFFLE